MASRRVYPGGTFTSPMCVTRSNPAGVNPAARPYFTRTTARIAPPIATQKTIMEPKPPGPDWDHYNEIISSRDDCPAPN